MSASWPEGIIARYLTVGGATVGITVETADPANPLYVPRCGGCGTTAPHDLDEYDARIWAQTHAETCRALPRPRGAA